LTHVSLFHRLELAGANGVLDMAFLSIIRRWHKREHVPIREISRRLGVSRNTICKYLRSNLVEPKFQVLDRPSKLDPYAEKLAAWLQERRHRPSASYIPANGFTLHVVGVGVNRIGTHCLSA
jgi:transcriptional regulator with XRE-family HTH domain